jgi:hypothetical protein
MANEKLIPVKIHLQTPTQLVGMTETVWDVAKNNATLEETTRGVLLTKNYRDGRLPVTLLIPWANVVAVQYASSAV